MKFKVVIIPYILIFGFIGLILNLMDGQTGQHLIVRILQFVLLGAIVSIPHNLVKYRNKKKEMQRQAELDQAILNRAQSYLNILRQYAKKYGFSDSDEVWVEIAVDMAHKKTAFTAFDIESLFISMKKEKEGTGSVKDDETGRPDEDDEISRSE